MGSKALRLVHCYDAGPFIYDRTQRVVHLYALIASGYTGKERDSESGLDYFGARYYGSTMGRWMSPDWADKPEAVPYSDLSNPQSLNLYGYVNNNPLSKADPDGHCPICWGEQLLEEAAETPAGQAVGNAIGVAGTAVMGFVATHASEVVDSFSATGGASSSPYYGPSINNMGSVLMKSEGGNAPAPNAGSPGQPTSPQGMSPKPGESGGPGQGKDFNDKTKAQGLKENQDANGGQAKCVFCKEPVGSGTGNNLNFDHANAKTNGGNNSQNNLNVTCEYCNKSKGTGPAPKNPKQPQ
jgi:RHS repeat-associated protein